MIIIIDALNKHKFGSVLREMHRLRARVFEGRLGWDVKVRDGMERDMYDDLNPAHVVSLDDGGHVVGCMRLLQTTGPHMLADVFSSILDGEPPLRSAQLWEATRFCVDTKRLTTGKTRNSISYVTSEVMVGAFEYAMKAGVRDAVAVIDPVMNRVLTRSGNAPYDYVGSAKPMGKVTAMAALMDCSAERVASVRAFAGIEGDVFATEEEALARFALSQKPKPVPALSGDGRIARDLEEYFSQQMLSAETPDEAQAVMRLMSAVTEQLGAVRKP
ncbi:MAG: GNAT family N-acetyltransferase [Sedimentitalea sp.]|nr:GNAT family N-acetyltransferase [Sedimentitalea sp.]